MTITIFTDKLKAQIYSDLIHQWLIKNRKDYHADRWGDINICKSDKVEEYYVKVPPDYEVLNSKIIEDKDKLEVSKDASRVVDRLPDDWKNIV